MLFSDQSSIVDASIHQPKYQQLIEAVVAGIERGELKPGQQLPSITEWSTRQNIARVTVAKAYEELRQRGLVISQHGKGFYVASGNATPKSRKILLIFDTLNACKETLYEALVSTLPTDWLVNVLFHHGNRNQLEKQVEYGLGHYSAYVIMPPCCEDVSPILSRFPADKLLLLDHDVPNLPEAPAVLHQDFRADIRQALEQALDRLQRYRHLTLVLARHSLANGSESIMAGFEEFCKAHNFPGQIIDRYNDDLVQPETALLLLSDQDLVAALRQADARGLVPGRAVGIISYHDTPMKQLIGGGITVVSTDFAQMGRAIGEWLIQSHRKKIANPAQLTLRNSL